MRLLERDAELAAIARSLAHARAGAGSVVYLAGPAWAGRSCLLQAAAQMAQAEEMRILTARGADLERDFAFGVAVQLFEPAWRSAEASVQAASLQGPARLAGQFIGGALEDTQAVTRDSDYTLIHALFSLLCNLRSADAQSRSDPVAVIVDDVHWADEASLRFLAYLGERISSLPIALIVAARDSPKHSGERALTALRASAGNDVLRLRALSDAGVRQIVCDELPDAQAEFVLACARTTNGNPFLLVELLGEVRRARLAPDGQTASRVDELVPPVVLDVVASRLSTLATAAALLASAVAVLGDVGSLSRVAVLTGLDLSAATAAAETLVAENLLRQEMPPAFLHPLVGSAVRALTSSLRRDELVRCAAALSGSAPAATARMTARTAVSTTARLSELGNGEGDGDRPRPEQRAVLAHLCLQNSLQGAKRGDVARLAEIAWDDGALLRDSGDEPPVWPVVAAGLLFVDELERSLEICEAAMAAPAATINGHAEYVRAWSLYHQGQVSDALAIAGGSLDAVGSLPQPVGLSGPLAACLLQSGRLDEADRAIAVLEQEDGVADIDRPLLLDIRAQLRLAQLRPREAIVDATEAGERAAVDGVVPGVIAWRSTAALGHLALGDRAAALELAGEDLGAGRRSDAPRLIIRALRVLGLAERGTRSLDLLEEAATIAQGCLSRLEHVHALIDFGGALRRTNHRSAARGPLQAALELSSRGGSHVLAERARSELAAIGARPRRVMRSGLDALTPSERRVADLAARGLTTRQIAESLFVTRKTVEFHLRHVYRKLGVPSTRTELTRILGETNPELDPRSTD